MSSKMQSRGDDGIVYDDYPLDEIEKSFKRHRLHGGVCFQKFTCSGCHRRLTVSEPFKIYTQGTCDNCNAVTNIEEQGCNFIMILSSTPEGAALIQRLVSEGRL